MSQKTILYLMEYPIDLPGGGQMSTQTLCEGLVDKYGDEFKPVVCCPNLLSKDKSDYPFEIVTFKSDENREDKKIRRIFNFFRRIGSFYKIIRKLNPDLIHISMSESLITFGALRCIGIFADIPFVYTDRGLASGYRKHSLFCIKKTLKHASALITTTEYNKSLWLKHGLTCPIFAIPNTISRVFEDFDENKRILMREKYNIDDNDLVLGFAGRISEEKDWLFVPELVQSLAASGLRFKIALVISTYEEKDEEIAAAVKKGICDAIGTENLIYMQDLSQAEIADYYYIVDIFVMSSCFESFGKAAVEAMSRKCDVLSTAVGGLPEVVSKPENLYTKDNIKKFVDRVNYLNTHRNELDNDREFFFRRYKDNYTIDANVSGHAGLYREIFEQHSENVPKKKYYKWIISTIVTCLILFFLCAAPIIHIDPLFHYHAPLKKYTYPLNDERYQNDGITRHFEYNGIITGTSEVENFKTSEADSLFNASFIKVPFSGENFKLINDNLKRGYDNGKKILYVIRSLDYENLDRDKDAYSYGNYPLYLYNDNPFDDVNYVCNKFMLNQVKDILYNTKIGTPATSFDEYANWNADSVFGKEAVLDTYKIGNNSAQKPGLSDEEIEMIKGNINQNIVQIAKDHPETAFYLFFPPYSICYWDTLNDDGEIDRQIDMEELAISEILDANLYNLRLYSFTNDFELICNLDNYKDRGHYGEWVNSWILEQFQNDKYLLTKENCNEYTRQVRVFYKNYDYASLRD